MGWGGMELAGAVAPDALAAVAGELAADVLVLEVQPEADATMKGERRSDDRWPGHTSR